MRSGFFVLFVLALVAGTALGAKGGGGKGDQTDDNDNAPSSTIVKDPLRPAVGINGSADDRCTLQVHGPTCWGTDLSCVPLTPTVFTNVACQHTYIDELTVGTLNGGGGGAPATCLEGYYRATATNECTLCPIDMYCSGDEIIRTCTRPCTTSQAVECPCARCHPTEDKCLQCARGAAPDVNDRCDLCEPGYVSPDGLACVPCTPGTYEGQKCLPCAADTFSAAAATVCVPCPEGTTSNPGSSQCVSDASCSGSCASVCPRGTYTVDPNAETPECVACPPRTWSDGTTTTSCTPCATDCVECYATTGACVRCTPGMEPADSGSGCTDCSAGEYSADGAACIPCIPGTTSSSPKSAGCTPCGVGAYSTGFGQTACTTCSLGTFNPSTGAASADACQQCPPGTHAGGGVPCTPCTHGLYAPDPGLSGGCASCRPGTYADYNGAAHCHTCDPLCTDTCTPAAGSCTCPDGHFLEGVACIACPHGSWNIQGATTCTLCEIGDRCPSCGQGYYFQQSSDTCKPCPFGEWSDGTAIDVCTACLPNCDVCDPGTGICLHCADTYAHVGGNSRACEQCPEDTYYDGVSQTCNQCPPGTYYGGAPDNLCIACPAGSWNGPAGISTTCQDCAPGTADCATNSDTCVPTTGGCTGCSAGYGGSDCTPCEDDYWSDGTTRAPCQLCPYGCRSNDGTTAGRCATETGDCTICNAGFGGTECLECTDNTFTVRPTGGTDDCQPCSTTQNCVECYSHTGDCTLCDTGYVLNGVVCDPLGSCQAGTYYDVASDLCVACPTGTWNGDGTGTACQPCSSTTTNCATDPGTCDPETGVCEGCSAGYGGDECAECIANDFWSVGGTLDPCQPCNAGCTSNGGATPGACFLETGSCAFCNAGYGGGACTPCSPGTYSIGMPSSVGCLDCSELTENCIACSAETGLCTACDTGYVLNGAVCDLVQQCLAGTYYDATSDSCILCDPGFWSAGGNSDPCLACPSGCSGADGFCSDTTGECLVCNTGYGEDEYGGGACVECPAGTFGQFLVPPESCVACSFNTPNCIDCTVDTGTCNECEEGYQLNGEVCDPM